MDQLRRAGLDGLRTAVGDRRAVRLPRQARVRDRGRRRLPDVAAGTRDDRQPWPADQDHRHEQRLSRHGSPVAGAVLQQPPELGDARHVPAGRAACRRRMASRAARSRIRASLREALETAVAEPGPYLLNIKVTPFENVYPMVPAGGAINEMVLGPPQPVAVGD